MALRLIVDVNAFFSLIMFLHRLIATTGSRVGCLTLY